jgi:hypothetical protein
MFAAFIREMNEDDGAAGVSETSINLKLHDAATQKTAIAAVRILSHRYKMALLLKTQC